MQITTDTNELVDILGIQVDKDLSQPERINDFCKQIKDPNFYRCGGITVNAKYANNGRSIEDCLRSSVT